MSRIKNKMPKLAWLVAGVGTVSVVAALTLAGAIGASAVGSSRTAPHHVLLTSEDSPVTSGSTWTYFDFDPFGSPQTGNFCEVFTFGDTTFTGDLGDSGTWYGYGNNLDLTLDTSSGGPLTSLNVGGSENFFAKYSDGSLFQIFLGELNSGGYPVDTALFVPGDNDTSC